MYIPAEMQQMLHGKSYITFTDTIPNCISEVYFLFLAARFTLDIDIHTYNLHLPNPNAEDMESCELQHIKHYCCRRKL